MVHECKEHNWYDYAPCPVCKDESKGLKSKAIYPLSSDGLDDMLTDFIHDHLKECGYSTGSEEAYDKLSFEQGKRKLEALKIIYDGVPKQSPSSNQGLIEALERIRDKEEIGSCYQFVKALKSIAAEALTQHHTLPAAPSAGVEEDQKELATEIYNRLNKFGANLGNASIVIIQSAIAGVAHGKGEGWISVEDKLPDCNEKFGESEYLQCYCEYNQHQFVGWYNEREKVWRVVHHHANNEPTLVTHYRTMFAPPAPKNV